jgi:hypothetical protein
MSNIDYEELFNLERSNGVQEKVDLLMVVWI